MQGRALRRGCDQEASQHLHAGSLVSTPQPMAPPPCSPVELLGALGVAGGGAHLAADQHRVLLAAMDACTGWAADERGSAAWPASPIAPASLGHQMQKGTESGCAECRRGQRVAARLTGDVPSQAARPRTREGVDEGHAQGGVLVQQDVDAARQPATLRAAAVPVLRIHLRVGCSGQATGLICGLRPAPQATRRPAGCAPQAVCTAAPTWLPARMQGCAVGAPGRPPRR